MNTLLLNTCLNHRNFIHSQESIRHSIGQNEITVCSTGNREGVKSAIALAIATLELKTIIVSKCSWTNKKLERYFTQLGISSTKATHSLDSREIAKQIEALRRGNYQVLFITPDLLSHTEHSADLMAIIDQCCLVFAQAEKYAHGGFKAGCSYEKCFNFIKSIEVTARARFSKKVFLSDSASLNTIKELLQMTPHLSSKVFHSPKQYLPLHLSSTLLKSEADITKEIVSLAKARKSIILTNNSKRLFNTKYFISQNIPCISLLRSELESNSYSRKEIFSFNERTIAEPRIALTDSVDCLGTLKANRVFVCYMPHDIQQLCSLLQGIQNGIPFKKVEVSFLVDFEAEEKYQTDHIKMKYPQQHNIEALLAKLSKLKKPYFGKNLAYKLAEELSIELFELFSIIDLMLEFGCIKRRYNPKSQSHYFEILNLSIGLPYQRINERRELAKANFREMLKFFTSSECKLDVLNQALGASNYRSCTRCDGCGTTPGNSTLKGQPACDSDSHALKDELLVIRQNHSSKSGIPARMLFSDDTLEQIIHSHPTTIEQLNSLPQFADNDRWRHFGYDIIKAVARYQPKPA